MLGPYIILFMLQMSSLERARGVEFPHQWDEGFMVYCLGQSSSRELAFGIELGSKSISFAIYFWVLRGM